jgi:hypothetical protein
VFAFPAAFGVLPGLARCDCCGGVYRRRQVLPAGIAGRVLCTACAGFAARRPPGKPAQ